MKTIFCVMQVQKPLVCCFIFTFFIFLHCVLHLSKALKLSNGRVTYMCRVFWSSSSSNDNIICSNSNLQTKMKNQNQALQSFYLSLDFIYVQMSDQ